MFHNQMKTEECPAGRFCSVSLLLEILCHSRQTQESAVRERCLSGSLVGENDLHDNTTYFPWLPQAAMCERASAKVSNPDALLLIEAFKKHSRMDFFDYVTYTLNQLHPHLQP